MQLIIKNVLSKNELLDFRQALTAANWQDGKLTAGHQARLAKDNLQLPPESDLARQLGDHILLNLAKSQEFMSSALPNKIYPPMFNCYQADGQFGNHVDNAIRKIAGTPVKVRSDLSMTVFLSEPDEYDGGELVIEDDLQTNLTQQATGIKLAAGDMILYPSTSVHRVNPVTNGARFAAFFWLQSMVRSNHQRRILYDLDKSIQVLTQQDVKQPELVRLTGVYHNLLREWADT